MFLAKELAHLFQAFVGAHCGNSVALNKYVALCQELQCFEGGTIGPYKPLPPPHKLVFASNDVAYLDDIALHVVLQDFHCLQGARLALDAVNCCQLQDREQVQLSTLGSPVGLVHCERAV